MTRTGNHMEITLHDIATLRQQYPGAFGRTPAARIAHSLFWVAGLVAIAGAMWHTGVYDLSRIITGLGKLGHLLHFMFPPAHHGWLGTFSYAMLETLAMAFLGTLLASLAAFPLGVLGAKNMLPLWLCHSSLRRFLDVLRGVDALIWALVFVNVVGLGPFAGILALAVSDTGTLAKLYAEAIEHVDWRPVEGVRATGAPWLHVVRFGVLPQVLPVMLSHVLYYFESNTRSATILGVVGAGGIGVQLADRIRVNNWDEASYIILLILGTVAILDTLSRIVRRRLMGVENRQA